MDKEDVVYICTMEYYSAIKIWNIVIYSNMDEILLEIIILSEVSKKQEDKYYMISLICGI